MKHQIDMEFASLKNQADSEFDSLEASGLKNRDVFAYDQAKRDLLHHYQILGEMVNARLRANISACH